MNTAKWSDLTQPQRTIMVVVLMTGSFCTVLNQTLLATAYPTLMRYFAVNTSTVQWLTTGFLIVNGVMIPVSAYLRKSHPTNLNICAVSKTGLKKFS